jgi:hypothetical protein
LLLCWDQFLFFLFFSFFFFFFFHFLVAPRIWGAGKAMQLSTKGEEELPTVLFGSVGSQSHADVLERLSL